MLQHFHTLERILRTVAQLLDLLQGGFVHRLAALAAAGSREFETVDGPQQRIVFVNADEGFYRREILFDGGGVISRTAGDGGSLLKAEHGLRDGALRTADKLVHPEGDERIAAKSVQPSVGVGALFQDAAEGVDELAHILRPATVVEGEEGFGGRGVGFFEDFVEGFVHEAALNGIVEDAEGRVDAGDFEMGAQEVGAEGVKGGDGGALEADHLFAAAGIARGGEQGHLLGELGAHVGGGSAGEGDDEHAVDVGIVVENEAKNALDQDGGLARTRRRTEKKIGSARRNRPRLFIRPIH